MTLYSTTIAPNSSVTFPNQCMSGFIKNLGSTTTTQITIISEGMATLKKKIAPLQSFNFTNLYILKLYNQSSTNSLEASFSDSTSFAVSENPYAFSQVGTFEVVALGVTDINIAKISSSVTFNVSGSVGIVGNVDVTASGTVNIGNTVNIAGAVSITAGTVNIGNTVDITGVVSITAGTVSISGGTVNIGNTVNILGAVSISAGTVNIGNTVDITGVVSITSGSVSITGGTVNIGNTVNILGAVSISAGTVSIDGTVSVTGAVAITGNVSVTASGTVNIGNTVNIAGAVSISAGTVNIGNTVTIAGAVSITSGSITISSGTVNIGNTVNIAGAVSISAGTVNIGNTVSITGAVGITAGTVDINGTVNISIKEIATTSALNTDINKYLNSNNGTTFTLSTTAATALPTSTVQHFQIRNGSSTDLLYVGASNAQSIVLFPSSMFLWDANPNETTKLNSWYVKGTNGQQVIATWQV